MFKSILEKNPKNRAVLSQMPILLHLLKRNEEARAEITIFRNTFDANCHEYLQFAKVLHAIQDWSEALELLHLALECAAARQTKAKIYLEISKVTFKMALAHDPDLAQEE